MCNNSERAQCPHGPYCEAFLVHDDESECPKLKKKDTICNKCLCQPVCSIYRATGGVKKCEHHREEQRRGRWEQVQRWATKAKYRCSVCGREIMSATKVNIEKYPYCHCGADMRGAEDGN